MNFYPQYGIHFDPLRHQDAQEQKRGLRQTSNWCAWSMLLTVVLMTELPRLLVFLLKLFGYRATDGSDGFAGFTPALYYLTSNACYLLALLIPTVLYFAFRGKKPSQVLPFGGGAGPMAFLTNTMFGVAVCLLGNIPANLVAQLEQAFGFSGSSQPSPLNDDPFILFLYFVSVAVIPPLFEEFLFRGAIMGSLRKYGDGIAILASAVLFSLFHGNFVQFPFAFMGGIAMGMAVARTNNLWCSVLIHFINNAIVVATTLTQRYVGEEFGLLLNNALFYGLILLGVLSMIYLLAKNKRYFQFETYNSYFRFSTKLGAAVGNPGFIIAIVFCVFQAIETLVTYGY